jgi:ribosomal protein S18 acetylase RimI-like enzyme
LSVANAPGAFAIDRAGPEDAPAIADLWLRHLTQTSGEVDPTFAPALAPRTLAARLKRALAAGTLLGWIARAEGQTRQQLAGYLTARIQVQDPLFGDTFAYEPVLYIVDVDVEARFRRRGLSGLLTAHAEAHARHHRIRTLELAVVVRDDRAVQAWRKQGFETRVAVMRRPVAKR